jgi:hypothetical protein
LVYVCVLPCCVFWSLVDLDLDILSKMNKLDVEALDKVLQYDHTWHAVIMCPKGDKCEEFDLLRQTPQAFRKTKCDGKEGKLSHSRQHTHGIRIPTAISAVLGEWGNVKSQLCGWAWKGGSILVAKQFQSASKRSTLLDKTMRCSRCVPYETTSGMAEV